MTMPKDDNPDISPELEKQILAADEEVSIEEYQFHQENFYRELKKD